ncbi:MAG: fructosamine kinase [Phycisphaerae bacterium]
MNDPSISAIIDRIEAAVGRRPRSLTRLTGGCIADVYRASFPDGADLVAKAAGPEGALDVEAFMLGLLADRSRLPVPAVIHAAPDLLIMERVEGRSSFDDASERHAAELLADLHEVHGPSFGLERDTLIGSLPQRNTVCSSWVGFFRDHRLTAMADAAASTGGIGPGTRRRIGTLAARLTDLIDEPACPSLLHGDVWTGNVLANSGRIAAFLDPAVYYGHSEIELAFITLFSTFGRPFFERYSQLRPIRPGFFESRRHVYNLYPLLVHARLFGGHYGEQVSDTLDRIGF